MTPYIVIAGAIIGAAIGGIIGFNLKNRYDNRKR